MERLQNILAQQPESDHWEELIACLDNWPDDVSLSAAVEYAEQQLSNWPDYLQTAPGRQWQAIQDGVPLPRWWKLVRHLQLGEDDNILDPFPVEALQNITAIKLNDCYLLPEELYLLARLNKLGTLGWDDLIDCVDEWPEEEPMTEILDYAEEQLKDWPDEKREAPKESWEAIREGSPIPRWWKLVRYLELDEDDYEISPIEAFTNLSSLYINNSHLFSIEPLAELTNLTTLTLVDDTLPFNIEPIAKLTQLVSLRLALPELTHLDELAELKNLEKLDLSYGFELTNIQGLAALKKLLWLDLEECRELTDLTPLSQLTALEFLTLEDCISITDLSPLTRLNQLQLLNLVGCDALTDLTPLSNLTNLKALRLGGASLANLEGVAHLPNLQIYKY